MCGWGPFAREASVWEACCWYSGVINMFLNCLTQQSTRGGGGSRSGAPPSATPGQSRRSRCSGPCSGPSSPPRTDTAAAAAVSELSGALCGSCACRGNTGHVHRAPDRRACPVRFGRASPLVGHPRVGQPRETENGRAHLPQQPLGHASDLVRLGRVLQPRRAVSLQLQPLWVIPSVAVS